MSSLLIMECHKRNMKALRTGSALEPWYDEDDAEIYYAVYRTSGGSTTAPPQDARA